MTEWEHACVGHLRAQVLADEPEVMLTRSQYMCLWDMALPFNMRNMVINTKRKGQFGINPACAKTWLERIEERIGDEVARKLGAA